MKKQKLKQQTALEITAILFMSNDQNFKDNLINSLKLIFNQKILSLNFDNSYDVELPFNVFEQLNERFGSHFINEINIISNCGKFINLNRIFSELPDEFFLILKIFQKI